MAQMPVEKLRVREECTRTLAMFWAWSPSVKLYQPKNVSRNDLMDMKIYRSEYPRPDFVREQWLNLNGEWEFEFDDGNTGEKESWYKSHHFNQKIRVPFPFQSELSGISDTSFHNYIWYRKEFELPKEFNHKNIVLHFGAVDYLAKVWVNGHYLGEHKGGYVPFAFDITKFLKPETNVLVVKAEDFENQTQPRGKQSIKLKSRGCVYTRCSGIWQTVWLEPLSDTFIESCRITPNVDRSTVEFELSIKGTNVESTSLELEILFKTRVLAICRQPTCKPQMKVTIPLEQVKLWSPETPNLYDVKLRLKRGEGVRDSVETYFGMRKISIENGKILLNNEPYYLRMVLDQGYYPTGIYTAPSDETFINDIEMTKKLGFNGARLHQKIFDPRRLYWCDKLGLVVWAEMPNWGCGFSEEGKKNLLEEWRQVIRRDYNHPAIIAWVPFNEVHPRDKAQQDFILKVYKETKAMDPTRLVVDNSGYYHTQADICDIHDYTERGEDFENNYRKFAQTREGNEFPNVHCPTYSQGYRYRGEPIMISEYGGIGFIIGQTYGKGKDWGYGSMPKTSEEFIKRYRKITHAILKQDFICGFAYTQLYDVEQEINGLLTYDRKLKFQAETIAKINKGLR